MWLLKYQKTRRAFETSFKVQPEKQKFAAQAPAENGIYHIFQVVRRGQGQQYNEVLCLKQMFCLP